MKTSITATFTLESAHMLPHHQGKCARLHGHEYSLEVTISGPIQTTGPAEGMVMDFAELEEVVRREVIDQWDHQYLNDILPFPTTAENLAAEIFKRVSAHLPVSRVRLWETKLYFVDVEA
ncbi:6-carboxytetrahydropterin synthase QueD [Candidatus Kaiserbacteria bacterium]|nr:6-carboxytetrahydropterin synthase QueD [Candidatus Kaiserbacteria bacterium]